MEEEAWGQEPRRPAQVGGWGLQGPRERMSWGTVFQWPDSRVRAESAGACPQGKPGTSTKSGASRCPGRLAPGTQACLLWFHCPKHVALPCGLTPAAKPTALPAHSRADLVWRNLGDLPRCPATVCYKRRLEEIGGSGILRVTLTFAGYESGVGVMLGISPRL